MRVFDSQRATKLLEKARALRERSVVEIANAKYLRAVAQTLRSHHAERRHGRPARQPA